MIAEMVIPRIPTAYSDPSLSALSASLCPEISECTALHCRPQSALRLDNQVVRPCIFSNQVRVFIMVFTADVTSADTVEPNITKVANVWDFFILIVAVLVMVVGSLGNLLTLAAIPYVRRRYPAEFSLLQLPVTDLLFNLSVCDLIPHDPRHGHR